MSARRPRLPARAAAAAAVAIVTCAACSSGSAGSTSGAGTPVAARTATGTLTVRQSDAGAACRPTTPPALITPGTPIAFYDGSDRLLGKGALAAGHWAGFECVLPFTVELSNVAKEYRVSIAGNKKMNVVSKLTGIELFAGS